MFRPLFACLGLLLVIAGAPAEAGTLPKPTGEVVLTVQGKIANTNGEGTASFDMAMLEKLAGRTLKVETPWTKGIVAFEGPLGKALLEAVGSSGTTMRIRALNDYAVDVPVSDFLEHEVILATRRDGNLMSVREHGPIFVMYPFDREPALYTEKYFSRCVWQVSSILIQ